jgi:hypothetical protein
MGGGDSTDCGFGQIDFAPGGFGGGSSGGSGATGYGPASGGGGSGFISSSATNASFSSGVQTGDGMIVVTYTLPDTTAPTASPTQSPAANPAGWNTSNVTVTWNWSDNAGGSGIDPSHCTQTSTSSGEGTLTLTATCDDLAGNQGTASYTVKVDKTPPTNVTGAPTSSPNANGWYDAPVTVAFTGQDATSGIASCTSTRSSGPDSAAATVSGTCTDVAGNVSAPVASQAFKYDATPPTISASATKADGSAYAIGTWSNQAVTVHFTCQDGLSGVASCPADQVFGADGANQAASGTATDNAGNPASASFGPIQIDKTAPTISAATIQPNANGWYNANVTVRFTCTDALSGIPAGTCPADQVLSTEGSAVSSTAQTVTDAAGNVSAPSNVVTAKIDKTPPVVTVTGVSNGATYTLGNVPTPGCSTSDALSGVASAATLQVSGGNPDGSGTFTATCSGATDEAGNAAAPVSATYTVGYHFSGFLPPIANPPTVNVGHAGRTYPVKFQLTDANGGFVSALSAVSSVTYQATSCGAFSSNPTGALDTSATGGTSLRYDSSANQYVYNWTTPSTPGCYTLFLTVDSGQVFPAYLNLQ